MKNKNVLQNHSPTSALKGLVCFLLVLVIPIWSAANAQEYDKFTRLGTSQAICKGGVKTVQELQDFFANNPSAISDMLIDAGWPGEASDLIRAVAAGQMIKRSYPVGSRFDWTGAKVSGKYVAKPYREWAGSKSMEAFQVDVSSGCNIYHMAIPKACCNVSLVATVKDESPACAEPAVVAVVAVEETAVPKIVPKKVNALIPFVGAFAGTETRPRFEPSWNMDNRDSSGIVGIRAGLLKELNSKTAIFGQLSYYDRQGVNDGNIYPEDNFAIDLGVERKFSKNLFFGGGIGAWNIDDSDFRDASIFGHLGGDIGKSNFQWIVEGRVFDSDSANLDSVSSNRMFSAGLRYLIK